MSRLVIACFVVALAACSQTAPPLAQLPPPARVGPPQGIDMATDARDVSGELKGSHVDFVARYYRDAESRWPTLSPAEAATLSAQGYKIVVVWESHSGRPSYFSYASGFADGVNAYRQAKAIGQPADSAIYFAVDYNAQAPDIYGSIDHYFRGVANGLASVGGFGQYKIGVYGSGAVCGYLKYKRLAQYAWLSNSTAWTGYDSFRAWNIRQLTTFPFLSFGHDRNEAAGDYGGFQVANQYSAL